MSASAPYVTGMSETNDGKFKFHIDVAGNEKYFLVDKVYEVENSGTNIYEGYLYSGKEKISKDRFIFEFSTVSKKLHLNQAIKDLGMICQEAKIAPEKYQILRVYNDGKPVSAVAVIMSQSNYADYVKQATENFEKKLGSSDSNANEFFSKRASVNATGSLFLTLSVGARSSISYLPGNRHG